MPKPILLEVMKARAGIPTNDLFAMLWAQKLRAGSSSVQTLTGIPPLSFKSNGTPLISWIMKGNGQQQGTQTPDNPVMPEFVGVRTGNLFDKTATDTNNGYMNSKYIGYDGNIGNSDNHNISEYIAIPVGTEHLTISNISASTNVHCQFYDSSKNAISIFLYDTIPCTVSIPSNAKYIRCSISKVQMSNFMLNIGSTALPYEPYGWAEKITCAGQTTPVYLGQTQTVRKIKKLVLDGTENWDSASADSNRTVCRLSLRNGMYVVGYCTHISWKSTYEEQEYNRIVFNNFLGGSLYVSLENSILSGQTAEGFKAYLAAQYAAGTPVVIWYVLANEQTGIVNEPLCKIGDYADELHSEDAGVTIPTVKGDNVLTVDTPIQPSEMSITYKG